MQIGRKMTELEAFEVLSVVFSSVQTFELTTHKPQRLAEELCQFTGLTIIKQFGLVTRGPYSRVLAIPFLS